MAQITTDSAPKGVCSGEADDQQLTTCEDQLK